MSRHPYLDRVDPYDRVDHEILWPMIDWLCAGQQLEVLDAGCGEGFPALMFADLGCSVVGIDVDQQVLQIASQRFQQTQNGGRVELLRDDMQSLPFEDGTFDLVWSSRALHHVPDRLGAIRELARVLRPGGRLAIREDGLPVQLLPFELGLGKEGLQDRMRVAQNRWFVAMCRATMPDAKPYPYGWLQLVVDAGMEDVTARTFVQDFVWPFSRDQKEFIHQHIQVSLDRDAGQFGPLLDTDDRQVLEQLADPTSRHYILCRGDLHVRYGLSLYVGRKPDAGSEGSSL